MRSASGEVASAEDDRCSRATGHAVRKEGSSDSADSGDTLVGKIQTELGGDVGVSEVVVDNGVEVSKTVSRELSEDRNHEDWKEKRGRSAVFIRDSRPSRQDRTNHRAYATVRWK